MSDIFISYASEDRDRVKSLARALEQEGWSVWWDRAHPHGEVVCRGHSGGLGRIQSCGCRLVYEIGEIVMGPE